MNQGIDWTGMLLFFGGFVGLVALARRLSRGGRAARGFAWLVVGIIVLLASVFVWNLAIGLHR
jgi:membrane-bound ClpP family serine protease